MCLHISLESLNSIRVGTVFISKDSDSNSLLSISMRRIYAKLMYSYFNSSITGDILRHGIHHKVWKSAKTKLF